MRKFSVIQVGADLPLSKPVAQEYCWTGTFCVLALAPRAGIRRPASAIPAPTVILVMVLFMIPLPLGVGGLRRGKLWVIATPGENIKNPEQRHPDRWRQWNSRRLAYRRSLLDSRQ